MRLTPYTERGIRRIPCFRCGTRPSRYQWQICADRRVYRTLCAGCDVELNALVLRWANHPDAERLIEEYKRAVC